MLESPADCHHPSSSFQGRSAFYLTKIANKDSLPVPHQGYNIQLSPEGEVNSDGYNIIPRCKASRYISSAMN